LVLIGSALMVSVDPAMRAEEVLRQSGIETVARQGVLTLKNFNPTHLYRDSDRTAHSTIRAGAAANCVEAVTERRLETNRTTVALAGPYIRVIRHGCLGLLLGITFFNMHAASIRQRRADTGIGFHG
jgi:hypothetical protein